MAQRKALRALVAVVALALVLSAPTPVHGTAGAPDILERIRGVAGVVSVEEAQSSVPGTRFFLVEFEQPVDHASPSGPTFRQRLTVLHRDESAPTVLETSGYYAVQTSVQYEPTALLQANQINVEHRYFVPSRPLPLDWQFLNMAQSAADHHAIVEAFKAVYTGKWVSTGASKGGMASVFHRFYFPNDVDATIAYVTPSSHGTRDPRYVPFVSGLGSSKCQKMLLRFQKRALKKRGKLLRFMGDTSYDVLGRDRALEFAILEMPFIFWQYFNADFCDLIPGEGASPRQIYEFLDQIVSVESYSDAALVAYEPYFYQSATQLGGPAAGEDGLEGLLRFPGQDGPEILPPIGVPKVFDPAVMPLIEDFVLGTAERMLFIYGENDPWSANAFAVNAGNDTYRLFVTGRDGNHGAQIVELSGVDREFALDKIGEWLDAPVARAFWGKREDPSFRIDRPTRRELFLR